IWLLRHIKLKNTALNPIVLLCVIFITFSFTELLHGNGYLAVYIAGIVVGNFDVPQRKESLKFLDGVTWLMQIVIFITLGLLVNPHELLDIAPAAIAISVFVILIGRPIAVFLSLLPFKKPASFKARLFTSWVGLRGATPIIFATYPIAANIPAAKDIFNIVFFITLISLILQGTSIPWVAKKLDMVCPLPKKGNDFGVELPDEIDSKLWDITMNERILRKGNRIRDLKIPKGTLIIMVKRNEEYLVPDGNLELYPKDKLLAISKSDLEEAEKALAEADSEADKAEENKA
ncbi:MAG: cation:proton antiporter, partial [Bacteroidales bacterium]|nr:cation:proton antiporter [Bacteroidales bacterium]